MNEDFATRRAWFDSYGARRVTAKNALPPIGIRHSCPCCGYLTLPERGGYEVCCLCNWEDDGQDDPHADEVWGGPNSDYSLSRARQNFPRELVMYDSKENDTRLGGPDSTSEVKAKRAIISAFNSMASARNDDDLQKLWRDIARSEAVLRAEVRLKVKKHEARQRRKRSV